MKRWQREKGEIITCKCSRCQIQLDSGIDETFNLQKDSDLPSISVYVGACAYNGIAL